MIEVTDRLFYWTVPHPAWRPNPEWPEDVGCALFLAEDATVLIDPLVSDVDEQAWDRLDATVAAAKAPVAILLTAPWHERSTRDVAARYGAPIWAEKADERLGDLPRLAELPAGVDVFRPGGVDEGQVAFVIESERALVVAEFFLGTGSGLQVLPSPATTDQTEFVDSLARLTSLPIERVLVAHGPPVLANGRDAIAAAVAEFQAGA